MQDRWVRVFSVLVVIVALSAPCTSMPASAEDDPWKAQVVPAPWREVWAGVDATSNSWSVYTGMTVSPFGSIHHDGLRVRVAGGYGAYSYQGTKWRGTIDKGVPIGKEHNQTYRVDVSFADLLAGYHATFGVLTIKGFAGVAVEGSVPDPIPGSQVSEPDGTVTEYRGGNIAAPRWGAKVALETWLEMSPHLWASLDVSATLANEMYASRLRLGYRVTPELSLGLEGAATGNFEYDGQRGGLFARYAWSSGEVAISAGTVNELTEVTGAYGTLNVLYQY